MYEFLRHEPCPECGSKDNLSRYDDGHAYCFGCDHYEAGEGEAPASRPKRVTGLMRGEYGPLSARCISEDTCKHLDYAVGMLGGRTVQIASYYDDRGVRCAQKLRFPDKTFRWVGEPKRALLYGQQRWKAGGRRVVITEGEIDALSVDEVQDRKWPVVSVPNGAQSAKAACLIPRSLRSAIPLRRSASLN